MAATELGKLVAHHGRPAGPAALWLRAYLALWAATLLPAGATALAKGPVVSLIRRALELRLSADSNPPPHAAAVLALAAHNIPIAAWPLLLGLIVQHGRPGGRIADGLVLACLLANALPVGAALGAYGARLLPYLPQLPLEWAALALGASSWLVQRERALSGVGRLAWLALIAAILICAAILETVAVAHR